MFKGVAEMICILEYTMYAVFFLLLVGLISFVILLVTHSYTHLTICWVYIGLRKMLQSKVYTNETTTLADTTSLCYWTIDLHTFGCFSWYAQSTGIFLVFIVASVCVSVVKWVSVCLGKCVCIYGFTLMIC